MLPGGKSLPLDRRHHVFGNGTLVIPKVTRKDGEYSCSAKNRQGTEATETGLLKVIGKNGTIFSQPLSFRVHGWIENVVYKKEIYFYIINSCVGVCYSSSFSCILMERVCVWGGVYARSYV